MPDVGEGRLLLGVVGLERVLRLFDRLFDEDAFLSPYGLRAVSRYHAEHPSRSRSTAYRSTIDYEPAESTTGMFGGNSNWRGPDLDAGQLPRRRRARPLRALLRRRAHASSTRPAPASEHTLDEIAADLRDRLISLFLVGPDGRRPCFGWVERLQTDPAWKDNILFNEYFHGDNGAGPRRLAPDRLDGHRRRPDPAGSRGGRCRDARRAARGAPRASLTIALRPAGVRRPSTRRRRASGSSPTASAATRWARSRACARAATTACWSPRSAGPARRMLGLAALEPVLVVGDARFASRPTSGPAARSTRAATSSSSPSTSTTASRAGAGRSATSWSSASSRSPTAAVRSGVVHRLVRGRPSVRLELTPLCTWRSVHGERFGNGDPGRRADGRRLRVRGRLPGCRRRLGAGRRVVPRASARARRRRAG